MTFEELKKMASEKVHPRQIAKDCYVASVACALLTEKGTVFTGVCIDTPSSMGFCAEHSAIAQMITNEESRIIKIVAVGKNDKVYPPCGRCREFIYQINNNNLETEVMVDDHKIVKLTELLPYRLEN